MSCGSDGGSTWVRGRAEVRVARVRVRAKVRISRVRARVNPKAKVPLPRRRSYSLLCLPCVTTPCLGLAFGPHDLGGENTCALP